MTTGEIILATFLKVLLVRLASHDVLEYARRKGVTKKLMRWRAMVCEIQKLVGDAEKQLMSSEAVHQWLIQLMHLAYDMDDIVDSMSTHMLIAGMDYSGAGSSMVQSFIPKIRLFFSSSEVEAVIAKRLENLSAQKRELFENARSIIETSTSSLALPRSAASVKRNTLEAAAGRDGEIKKIVGLLSRDWEPSDTANFHSLAIVGMPGVGKTTLAAHVFDSDATSQFNPKVWVTVSHNFNLERIMRYICRKVTSRQCDQDDFSDVLDDLSKEITGQKFLIVLDDVWSTCDYPSWTIMQSQFSVGAPGSQIVVTTREEKVAKLIGATQVYHLDVLSDEECLKVVKQHINKPLPINFDPVHAKKIVEKCKGLPLAARTLGGILRCEEVDNWKDILDDKLWSLSNNGSNILPVQKLSYHHLPSTLKTCFAYCSIFPNNCEFGKQKLILLWMAEGFLQPLGGSNQMEDVGGSYFDELVSRSLFQKSKTGGLHVMHDLVGDLARWASGDTSFRLEDKVDGICSPKIRHSSYVSGKLDVFAKFEMAFSEAKCLRTFLPFSVSHDYKNYLSQKVTSDLLPKLKCLRVLSFRGYQIKRLPDSIGDLKHLRYLDLSHTLIMSLPESTSTLYNLQTLIVDNCSQLKALPEKLKQLTKLRHLKNVNVPSLEGMPRQLSQLTSLQSLSVFVVSKGNVSSLREIGPLLLRWTLCLTRLENVTDVEDATRANILSKEGLETLQLEWSGSDGKESYVLNGLKPHSSLKELIIKGYNGVEFPLWIQQPFFSHMALVVLENCKGCRFLPALGQLPSLKELHIKGMSNVESVGAEFYGKAEGLPFPSLEVLEFKDMQSWKEWLPWKQSKGNVAFPSLKLLSIFTCPKLIGNLPENIPLLSELVIKDCEKLVVSTTNYKLIRKLDIAGCKLAVDLSGVQLEGLEHMELSCVSEFKLEPEEFLKGFTHLKSLKITGCEELTLLWESRNRWLRHRTGSFHFHFVQELMSLRELHIIGCSNLISFPEVDLPPNLKHLKIESCSDLVHFTKSIMPLTLRRIEIADCLNLKSLVEAEASSSSSSSLGNEEVSCLEYLMVQKCPSLISLLDGSQLPRSLEQLYIWKCQQLKSVTDKFQDNAGLKCVDIRECPNLKSLPEGLSYLTKLTTLYIFQCRSLGSFKLPTVASNFTTLCIWDLTLTAPPEAMVLQNLMSLQSLTIAYSDGLVSFLEEGFPSKLTVLRILNPKFSNKKSRKPLSEWGMQLKKLTSLKELWISGVDPFTVSFPPENMELMLPKSLIKLDIRSFPSLRRLSKKAIQSLTSLECLEISDCQELETIAENYLPPSLAKLHIYKCQKLKLRYKCNVAYWSKLAHIPWIHIDDMPNSDS